jgi:hypothetical protein
VSTVKNPEEKRRLSLARDRRNRYGENSKASRKSIQRGKQRRHMDERRTAGEALGRLKGCVKEEDEATEAELRAKTRITDSQRRGFRKRPDTPLGVVLAAKKVRKKVEVATKPVGRAYAPCTNVEISESSAEPRRDSVRILRRTVGAELVPHKR